MVPSDPAVVRFIRDVLGCGCPDELLREIRIERSERASDLEADFIRVEVGGRLLVWVFAVENPPSALSGLVSWAIAAGLKERDRLSFKRFRVVLANPNPSATSRSARLAFDACCLPDDRVHLHVVDLRSLPASIRPMSAVDQS